MSDPIIRSDLIRYGRVINNETFTSIVAPTTIEINHIEDLRNQSININQPIAISDPSFIRIVNKLDCGCNVPETTSDISEVVNEIVSISVNGFSYGLMKNSTVTDCLISKDSLEVYAKLSDSRIVNFELPIEEFITSYRDAISLTKLVTVNGVQSSEKIWMRVLQLVNKSNYKHTTIVNPYSDTYSQIHVSYNDIVYKRYPFTFNPVFDDFVEKITLTESDINRAMYQI